MEQGTLSSRAAGILLIVAAGAMLAPRAALADVQVIDSGIDFWSNDTKTDPGRLPWLKVEQLFTLYLSDAKQVNIYTDLCHDGQLVNLQADPKTALSLPYVIGTATQLQQESSDGTSTKDKNPPGRLAAHDTKDNVIPNSYYYGFNAYLTKRLRNQAPVPTAKQLYDSAAADVAADNSTSGTPQYATGNGADPTLPVNGGAFTDDLVFAGHMKGLDIDEPDQNYLALKALNPKSLQYYNNNLTAGVYNKVTLDGQGTIANLKTALANIQTQLAANKGNGLVNLFFTGHGIRETKNVNVKPNAIPNMPKQGQDVAPPPTGGGTMLNVEMTPDFWQALSQGVTQNTPGQVVGDGPDFFISASEANITAPFGVTIGGVFLGDFTLPSASSGGASLNVPLSNSFLSQLIATDGGDSQLPITFDLAPGDSFRIATEDDMLYDPTYTQNDYGVGISEDVAEVPEPGVCALIVGGMLLLVRPARGNRNGRGFLKRASHVGN